MKQASQWQSIDSAPEQKFVLVRGTGSPTSRHSKYITIARKLHTVPNGVWFDNEGKVVRLPDEWMEIPQ